MVGSLARYLFLALLAGAFAYAGYRMLTPVNLKVTTNERIGKEERAEGVVLSDAQIVAAGIELAEASPGVLRDSLLLNGIVQPNQETLVQIAPRFPGIVRDVRKRIGDHVQKGEVLAIVESNKSLTPYELRASLTGIIIDRQMTSGEYASEQRPAFVIADLSTVWVDFSVSWRDLNRVRIGNVVHVDPADDGPSISSRITYLSPIGNSETQSVLARAIVMNSDLRLRPGLYINGRLILSERKVGIAVKSSGLQTVRGRTVVFVRKGDKLEVRDVQIGDRDNQLVEIAFGVRDGEIYAARNSFILKAKLAIGSGSDTR